MGRLKKQIYRSDQPPIALRWRPHDNTNVRVWTNRWFGDQFEIISIASFNELSRFCKMFNIPLEDYTDED